MKFDSKIAVVVRDDLATWQKLNITAFTVSGIASTVEGIVGEPYEDGSGNRYLPMFRQPVMIFSATSEQIKRVYERALHRQVQFSLFTEDLFQTDNDVDNRAAVKARPQADLGIVGMALWAENRNIERVLKGIDLHP